ncbi:MAG: class I SAM-dependent methyltransferase [Leptolyngbya sp. PLA1]|nr:class I SAM-dependent methyltransferase [Leptolyngbya sp. PLA1]
MARAGPLARSAVVEIGCGTGSSTAALAPHVAHIQAYDIAPASVAAAQSRLAILGLSERADCTCFEPKSLLATMVSRARVCAGVGGSSHPQVDIVLIYAVLEHQTVSERLETLRVCWEVLRPGGVLVVADTPNRLTYWDAHTSELPFYHMLPDSIALPYAARSPRAGLRDSIAEVRAKGHDAAAEVLARWGRGVSYHEFELALGDLTDLVIADGFAPEMMEWLGLSLEEEVLIDYWKRKPIPVPIGFARKTIDVILRKPEGDAAA